MTDGFRSRLSRDCGFDMAGLVAADRPPFGGIDGVSGGADLASAGGISEDTPAVSCILHRREWNVDVLPAASGEDSYGAPLVLTRSLRWVPPTTALLQRRTTKRLYFWPCPAIGLLDLRILERMKRKKQEGPYIRVRDIGVRSGEVLFL